MATTINASVYSTEINASVNDITVNVRIGVAISQLSHINGDTMFKINGSTEPTGFKYDTTENAIIFYINNVEVGRMMT